MCRVQQYCKVRVMVIMLYNIIVYTPSAMIIWWCYSYFGFVRGRWRGSASTLGLALQTCAVSLVWSLLALPKKNKSWLDMTKGTASIRLLLRLLEAVSENKRVKSSDCTDTYIIYSKNKFKRNECFVKMKEYTCLHNIPAKSANSVGLWCIHTVQSCIADCQCYVYRMWSVIFWGSRVNLLTVGGGLLLLFESSVLHLAENMHTWIY